MRKIITLSLLLAATAALAQSVPAVPDLSQYTAAASNDWTMKFWESILGPFATSPFGQIGAPTTLLGKLFVVFNSAIFAVGCAWVTYGIVVGVVGTAQEGQALGQRINTAWYPIRVITGISGMLPVLGGFTLAQGLLMWLGTLGIGIANAVYKEAVESPQLTQMVATDSLLGAPVVGRGQTDILIENILRSRVCSESVNYAWRETEAGLSGPWDKDGRPDQDWIDASDAGPVSARVETTEDGARILYGSAMEPEVCGSVSARMERSRSGDGLKAAASFRVASVDYSAIRSAIADGVREKLLLADELIAGPAKNFVLRSSAFDRLDREDMAAFAWDTSLIDRLAAAMIKELQGLAAGVVEGKASSITDAAKKNMLGFGWVGAGAWHSTFAEANAALASAVSGIRFGDGPLGGYHSTSAREHIERLNRVLARRTAEQAQPDGAVDAVMRETCGGQDSKIGTATGNCSLGQAIVSVAMSATVKNSGGGDLVNPVIASKNIGDYTMWIGSTLVSMNFSWLVEKTASAAKWAGRAAAAVSGMVGQPVAAGVASGVATAAAGVETVMAHAVPLGWTLLILGGFLAIYIPMLPFIVWIGALLTYAASFIEGLIAMPLHSMSHLHVQGEGMGQATSRGYLFMLNTLVRPPIMVLSFFIASALVIGLGTLATQLFLPAMASAQGNSVAGIASVIGYLVVYGILMITIVQGCFELVNVIPDQVIGFLGAGDVRSSLGHGTEQKINALFMASNRAGQIAGQGSAKAGNALQKERNKNNKDKGGA